MKRDKVISASQMMGLPADLEGMIQSVRGQETIGKEKKEENKVVKNEEETKQPSTSKTAVVKETEKEWKNKFKKSTDLSERTVDISENDSEMTIFNKYVDFYAGQPGKGRAVWVEDELVESLSILKDYDSKYSIRTVICAALRTFIEKNAKELGEMKRPKKKTLF